ncbi:MAG: GNAT family N-acetyltransferase [Propionibacteriales bacterium]|nr:GNAT family N-acetyltransferase [Propionibacteriales bacterium]
MPSLADFTVRAIAWAREHRDSHIPIVAVAGRTVVGMAWLAITARVPAPFSEARLSGDLQSCFVLPNHRGQGIGRRLAETVLAETRRHGLEHVTVHASPQSVPVYERSGFSHQRELLWAAVSDQ